MLKRMLPVSTIVLSACASAPEFEVAVDEPPSPAPVYALGELPFPETFNELAFNGSPIGFTYLAVEPQGHDEYIIRSQAFMNLNLIATEKVSVVNSVSTVDSKLRLKTFDYRYWVDGVESRITGVVNGLELTAEVTRNNHVDQQTVTLLRPVLASAALALVPALRGLEVGRTYNFSFFDGEKLRVKIVQQTVQAYEQSDEVEENAFRILSNVQGQGVKTWMSAKGQPLFESSMGGIVTARSTDINASAQSVVERVIDNQSTYELLGRVPTEPGVAHAESVIGMSVALDGLSDLFDVRSDLFQYCEPVDDAVHCETSAPRLDTKIIGSSFDGSDAYLQSSDSVPTDAEAVVAVAAEIGSGEPVPTIVAIVDWMAQHITLEPAATSDVVEVLGLRQAGVRGNVLLYAALARRLQIPTRVVHGIAYSGGRESFVFHSWAESWLNGLWHRVDPVFGQLPADGTHIVLMEGESAETTMPLLTLMGRLEVRVLDVHQ
jgi:hypothetical protein